ncbi:MAG: DNA-formamidopyrimidine glycosylase family protein, partial [Acidobacteriota bacterium]
MPEIPDLTVYLDGLRRFAVGGVLERVRLRSAFLLRSFDPPLAAAEQRRILEVSRLGKRLVLHLEDDLFLVLHLMITGRLRWRPAGAKIPGRVGLAAFDVAGGPRGDGTLMLTEVGKKRASLHLVRGEEALAEHDRGGLEVADVDFETFDARLRRNNHTLKRALTDPRIFAGIGNAYSDEILHRARL